MRPGWRVEGGREWTLPADGRPRPTGMRKMADRLCYRNAATRAMENRSLRYVEGWPTAIDGLPVHHAWCADPDGVVIEPTWTDLGLHYLGVEIGTDEVAGRALDRGAWSRS